MTDASEEIRQQRRTLIKCAAFLVLSIVAGLHVLGTLGGETGGKAETYRAIFHDVSGLTKGDPVRVAGVTVGRITESRLLDARRVQVTFTANDHQPITSSTFAQIRYANLLGMRFLALSQAGPPGHVLPRNGVIPLTRTSPAVSLTELLNGFQPLFAALEPKQINELVSELVMVLQGQTGHITNIMASVAKISTDMDKRADVMAQVVDNLSKIIGTVAAHDDQVARALDKLDDLTGYLADDSKTIGHAISSSGDMASALDDLAKGVDQAGLSPLVRDYNVVGRTMVDNAQLVHATVVSFPQAFTLLGRISQGGTFASGYPCLAHVATVGKPSLSAADIGASIDAYTGGSYSSAVLAALGVTSPTAQFPIDVPQGVIGDPARASKVCR